MIPVQVHPPGRLHPVGVFPVWVGCCMLFAGTVTAAIGPAPAGDDIRPAEKSRARALDAFTTSIGSPVVRVAYVVPTNRTAQAGAVVSLQHVVLVTRDWFRDQMAQLGFGAKTFRYETEGDGVTPRVWVVKVKEADSYLRGDLWTRTISAATNAGISVWAGGEVWLLAARGAHRRRQWGHQRGHGAGCQLWFRKRIPVWRCWAATPWCASGRSTSPMTWPTTASSSRSWGLIRSTRRLVSMV